uniref:Uncharacterized protein n=1 Tax=Helianthus annuus TaxID=4232 RepID=A0A251RYG2_HELAN
MRKLCTNLDARGKSSILATWRIGASACSCYAIPNASASLFKCFRSKICCIGF